MKNRHTKLEFVALLGFMIAATLVLTNGFVARISAQDKDVDIYAKIQPIGEVLNIVLDEYVRDPNIDDVVEGALIGMMNSLDKHSSYVSPNAYRQLREETKGEIEGIGVSIRFDNEKNVLVYQAIPDSPAMKAGIRGGDILIKIDGAAVNGMALDEVARRIRGPRNSVVTVTILRHHEGAAEPEVRDFTIKRAPVALESVKEARVLPGGVGYIRVSDFKDNTAEDLKKNIKHLVRNGMTSLVLDLRWNPGGMLTAPRQVCDLFLPKNTLVTYTQGRKTGHGSKTENMRLYTDSPEGPMLPADFPLAILTNDQTASSAEIVTGALQFWSRAIIVGEKTYGKGTVQTIIPLARPPDSALRLTTALYYTPAEVTIDGGGIKPDVEVPMSKKDQVALLNQMYESIKDDAKLINSQNHGGVTGGQQTEGLVEDIQLKRAVEILTEDSVFEHLLAKYHKDVHETQVAAPPEKVLEKGHPQELEMMRPPEKLKNTPEEAPEEEVPAPKE
jgi:carboxyl-terminal processing protease